MEPPPQVAQPLPEIFRGCWEGDVPFVDHIQRLPGAAPIGPWATKSYRLCYRRVGDGPFELTFTDTGVRHRLISNPEGRLQVVSTDGRSFAALRGDLHFDEYYNERNFFGPRTFEVDEATNMDCQISRDSMLVRASVLGQREGAPWFTANWHARFVHVPE
jgi:hypothetical protein